MALAGKTVLIIDDAPDIRIVLRRILENAGIAVIESPSVEEALNLIDKSTPHLIILDLNLPGESGFAFLERRKNNIKWKKIPVIVVSGATDRSSVYQAIVGGANDYLVKPVVASRLIQKIRKALRDQDFLVYKINEASKKSAVANLSAEILEFQDSTFTIESQVKLSPESTIKITSDELIRLGLDQLVFVTDKEPSKSVTNSFHQKRIHVVGLKEPITRTIASKWGVK